MWALILFFHIGMAGNGESNATSTLAGFESEQLCRAAGKKAASLVSMSTKKGEWVCVQLSK